MRSLPSLTPTCTSTGFVFSSLSQSIFSLSSFVSLPLFISQFLISTYLLYLLVHYLILPFCAWCFNSLFLHSFPHNALNSVALKWRRKNKISSALSVWSTKEAETTFWLSGPWCSTVSSALSLARSCSLSVCLSVGTVQLSPGSFLMFTMLRNTGNRWKPDVLHSVLGSCQTICLFSGVGLTPSVTICLSFTVCVHPPTTRLKISMIQLMIQRIYDFFMYAHLNLFSWFRHLFFVCFFTADRINVSDVV